MRTPTTEDLERIMKISQMAMRKKINCNIVPVLEQFDEAMYCDASVYTDNAVYRTPHITKGGRLMLNTLGSRRTMFIDDLRPQFRCDLIVSIWNKISNKIENQQNHEL